MQLDFGKTSRAMLLSSHPYHVVDQTEILKSMPN